MMAKLPAVSESFAGRVVILPHDRTASADARVSVEDETAGGGWSVRFNPDAAGFDPTELFEVELPNGGFGRFAYAEPAIPEGLGVGLGWAPTAHLPTIIP